jgi:hypothetical protein
MFRASKELTKLGLNLNASKAKLLNRDNFYIYWSFDIFNLLEHKNNITNVKKAFELFQERLNNNNVDFKQDAVLRRLLYCNINRLPNEYFDEIIKLAQEEVFITNAKPYYLGRIYNFLNKKQKQEFIKNLNKLSDKVLFNQYHLRVLRFARENNINVSRFSRLKRNLNRIDKI